MVTGTGLLCTRRVLGQWCNHMDVAEIGTARIGYFRVGCLNDVFDKLVSAFESRSGGSCDVTLRVLSLGARDSTTGWRAKEYTESTIHMPVVPRGSSYLSLAPGTYVREDALGVCAAGCKLGDEVDLPNGDYYEVKGVRPHYHTPDDFAYREVDLTKLPLHT